MNEWTIEGNTLYSSDFKHDAMLTLNGDFEGDQKAEYLQGLADKLNAGWQPIETAPRDGTWIMLWRTPEELGSPVQSEPMILARWSDTHKEFIWPGEVCDLFTPWGQAHAEIRVEDWGCGSNEFTHWQPLPTPPKPE